MKKVLLIAATALFVACNQTGYKISGEVNGYADGTTVYLSKIENNNFIKLDTAEVIKGKFTFTGETESIDYRYIEIVEGNNASEAMSIPLILENGKIKVIADKTNLENSKVTGTKNNDDLTKFNKIAYPISKEIEEFQIKNEQKFQKAIEEKDMQTVENLMTEFNNIQKKLADKGLEFVNANKDSYISLLLLAQFGGSLPPDELKAKFNQLSDEVKNTSVGKDVATRINAPAPSAMPIPAQETPQQEVPAAQAVN